MLVLPKKHVLTLPFFRQRNLYYEFTFTCKIHIDTQHSHTTQYTTTTKNQNSIISLTLLICFLLIPFSFREFLTYRNHHKASCQIIPINSSLENTFLTKLPQITKIHDPPLILSFFSRSLRKWAYELALMHLTCPLLLLIQHIYIYSRL